MLLTSLMAGIALSHVDTFDSNALRRSEDGTPYGFCEMVAQEFEKQSKGGWDAPADTEGLRTKADKLDVFGV